MAWSFAFFPSKRQLSIFFNFHFSSVHFTSWVLLNWRFLARLPRWQLGYCSLVFPAFSHVVRRDVSGYLGVGWTIFWVFVFFSHFTRRSFYRMRKKILFSKNLTRLWVVFKRLDSERWSLEYQGVCITPGTTISTWERLGVCMTTFSKEKARIFYMFPFHWDVINYLNVMFQNIPSIINCLCFWTVLWWM